MVDFSKKLTRPPIPGAQPAPVPETPAEAAPAATVEPVAEPGPPTPSPPVPQGPDGPIEHWLQQSVRSGRQTEVEFIRGPEGDPWNVDGQSEGEPFGWTAIHTDVGRDEWGLYVDTDEGMRYYVPEDRDIYIGNPRPVPGSPLEAALQQEFPVTLDAISGEPVPFLPPDPLYIPDQAQPAQAPAILSYFDDDLDSEQRSEGPPDEPQYMYLAGTAGTGKTWLARERATKYTDAMLCATTGIAAVNLGGVTINSILRYYDTASMFTEYEFGRLGVALRQLCDSGYLRLIIDECSMMDGRQLDVLMMAVDELNETRIAKHLRPLGITLVGDFAQLPPVEAPFVFQQKSWERFDKHTVMLTEPRRQADPEFVRALQAVRRGDITATDYFKPFIQRAENMQFDGSSITATNAEVERMNKLRMFRLSGDEVKFTSVVIGKASPEWKHIPKDLLLKPGALVMLLANKYDRDTKELLYANGDLGYFVKPLLADVPDAKSDFAAAVVKLQRNGMEVVVQRINRENKHPSGHKGVKKDADTGEVIAPRDTVEGTISYMPLRVAYATTVHKSQGLSLDNVQLMINSKFWMEPGMLYVALSRARTPQGLKIIGTADQFRARIRANPLIERWL